MKSALDSLDPLSAGAKRMVGKVCVVTGAGQGIGRAAAKRLGAEGGRIVIAERIAETAEETAASLRAHGVEVLVEQADVTRYAAAESLMENSVKAFGRIDVLVNVVGGTIWWQPFDRYDEGQIMLELERSLHATMWCCRAALPYMIAQKSGAIVNVSSAITKGAMFRAPYAASKGAVDALTRTLAVENGEHGIRVNAVAPGSTKISDRVTPRTLLGKGALATQSPDFKANFDEAARRAQFRAISRQATPEEQAGVIAFLASADAGYVTGQVIASSGDP
jgi:NAD(P)-dependent dehydrogenase (short-subunit alcohol dehydrogenase family)